MQPNDSTFFNTTDTATPPKASSVQFWVKMASIVVIIASLIVLAKLLPVDQLVDQLSRKIDDLGIWGPAVFSGIYVIAAVLFVPGSALTLAAGAIFGLFKGVLVVWVGATIGASVSFLIARYLARGSVQKWAQSNPRFGSIDRAIGQGGWKIIALLRLSPVIPFSLGNYLFGITSIRFWPYVFASAIFMLPGTFMYVYVGYAGRAGLGAATGADTGRSPAQWAMLIVGLLATIAVTVYVTHIAKKAVNQQVGQNEMDQDPQASQSQQTTESQPKSGKMATTVLAMAALIAASLAVTGCLNKSAIASLFGPPAVTLQETFSDNPQGSEFDHSSFDALLRANVNQEGLVNYRQLSEDTTALDAYIKTLAGVKLDKLGRDQRLALLINAYNAFTLRLILDHYPTASIRDIPDAQRWDAVRWNIGGQVLSLNQIEHQEIRPNFKEPRIHFALVCAAIGCPPLRSEAYTATKLEQQLDSQAKYVHTHSRWFEFDAQNNVVKLTSLYDWYGGDFEQVSGSVLKYAAGYVPALKAQLDAGNKPKVQYLNYDWSLNENTGAKK